MTMTTEPDPGTLPLITSAVVNSFAGCPDERLREIMQSLVVHLHAFARDTRLSEAEWSAGVRFLTEVGQLCSPTRQEFILLSDTLGLSMLVDALSHDAADEATESTVLGPFYAEGSPEREHGEAIMESDSAAPVVVHGCVLNPSGAPVADARIDVWQNSENMLYAVQDPDQNPENGRGVFRSDAEGKFWFQTVRPLDYPIPHDGPVGKMLMATGRHPWRPAHIHVICSAPGYETVTTHIFDDASAYLESDAVFGVKESLVRHFEPHEPDDPETPASIDRSWFDVDCSLTLRPARPTASHTPLPPEQETAP